MEFVGAQVTLEGLQKDYMNGLSGRVSGFTGERFVVRLDGNGKDVSVLPTKCRLSGAATAPGAAHSPSAAPATTISLPLRPMDWGADEAGAKASFLAKFSQMIKMNDPTNWQLTCGNPYDYIMHKLTVILRTKPKIGKWGWLFRTAAHVDFQHAAVWSDGTKGSQISPMGTHALPYEQWWPCVVLPSAESLELVPFICPALAWQDARPWGAHVSRIRIVDFFAPQQPPPPPAAVFASSVNIEEIFDDAGSSSEV